MKKILCILICLYFIGCTSTQTQVIPYINNIKHKNAIDASYASYASYLPLNDAEKLLQSRNLKIAEDDIAFQKITYLEMLTIYRNDDLIIAFTGTNDIHDINTDLDITPISSKNITYHKGFYVTSKKFLNILLNKLKTWRLKKPDSQLILTGHSLGGNIATIVGIELSNNNIKVDGIYTFGTPGCIIDTTKISKLPYHQENFINISDTIPKLLSPFYSNKSGLPGIYYDLGNDGSVIGRDSGWNLSDEKLNYSEGPFNIDSGISNFLNHSMSRYLNIMIKSDYIIDSASNLLADQITKNKLIVKTCKDITEQDKALDKSLKEELEKVAPKNKQIKEGYVGCSEDQGSHNN